MCAEPEPAGAPPDPVASENGLYEAYVSVYIALRRAGAGLIPAAAITAFHLFAATNGGAGAPEN